MDNIDKSDVVLARLQGYIEASVEISKVLNEAEREKAFKQVLKELHSLKRLHGLDALPDLETEL